MNPWLIAAIALLLGFAPCGYLLWRASLLDALVGLNLVSILMPLELILLAEGLGQSYSYDLALVLAVLSFAGSLVFVRFLERWR